MMDPLDAPTLDPHKTNPFASPQLIPESLYGKFGKYQIVEKIGQGGMGAVYRAVDPVLEREVAIKVPLLRADERAATLGRFAREAIAAAALRHPVICPVFEFSECEGIPFIVTPFLQGESLQDALDREGRWTLDCALRLVIQLADGLGCAHQHNIVHRDIKPQNVFLESNGTPIILDFGLAKVSQGTNINWTQSGEVLGTLAYMPPEQIDGSMGEIGPASDIYALGMTLYRMLTGRTAFLGDANFAIPQILMDRPRPPSQLVPEHEELSLIDALVLKSLEKKPKDRFASMHALKAELQLAHDRLGQSETIRGYVLPELRILGTGYRYRPSILQQSIRVGRQRTATNNPDVLTNDLVVRADGNQDRSLRISRQHMEIVTTQQGIGVIDRSQAGIAVNGRPAKRGEFELLKFGDIISVAGVIDIEVLAPTPGDSAPEVAPSASMGFEVTMGDLVRDVAK